MRLRIRHEIVQTFSPPAKTAIQILRLRPQDCDSQHVVSWSVDVDQDCLLREGRDAFGNLIHTIDAEGPLSKLTIFARGEVDTFDTAGVLRGEIERFPVDVFLRDTPLTESDPALRDFARGAVQGAKTDLDRPHFLMRAVHEAMELAPADAEPAADAAAAFERRQGRPQDFAHVFIAAARSIGLPARCVSGYLAPDPDTGKSTSEDAAAHVWAEAHVEGLGWIGFDPTIRLCMYEGHVRLACGLDHLGCAPLRAAPTFGADRAAKVRVEIMQAMSQRQS
jgi:transglutaminase-like putative cysteine protease